MRSLTVFGAAALVTRPRAQVHLPHGRGQELAAGLIHGTEVAHLGRAHVRVGGQLL